MAYEVIMPKAGMAMEEGTIVRWFKKEGERVEAGESLLEILTDKVNMEVEAAASGVLIKILRQEGEVVPVTQTIAYIGAQGEQVNAGKAEIETTKSAMPADVKKAPDDIYDVVVIGGGPAGYVAAIKAAQLGGKVALVEKDTVGGTCLNRGCIPTKTYLKNAELIESIRHAVKRGIMLDSTAFKMDMDKVVAQKNSVVTTLTSGVQGLLKSHNVKLYKGVGRITGKKQVCIDEGATVNARKIILAGGSKAAKINLPGIESALVLTSDEILDLKEVPGRLAIIGGGVIGIELATVFHAYGSRITVIEIADSILPGMDREVSAELSRVLTEKGIQILTGVRLQSVQESSGKLVLHLEDGKAVEADKALLSIGRVPDMEGLGDIRPAAEKGRVKVNERMETSVEGIYAPGDINGIRMLAHAAFKMGETAASNAMGKTAIFRPDRIPACIYTVPEAASVGLTEEEASSRHEITVGRFPFGANGRALASGEGVGFVKVIADKKYGEILGVHIVGPCAAELINEAAVLMEMEITVHEAAEIVHGHPTYSEAFMEAAADCLGSCIHLPKK